MLVVPAAGDGADAVTAGVAVAHDVSPSHIVPPTHSTPGPSYAPQVTPVTRVKRLEGLLQQQKRRMVLSDSEGEYTTPTEKDIDLEALQTLARTSLGGDSSDTLAGHDAADVPADTSMPSRSPSTTRRRLRKPFSSSASAHVPKNVPAGACVSAAASTIPAGRSVDAVVYVAAAPSSFIPTAADKGKAPMLGEELAKKFNAEQKAEFARQQEDLAQKAHAECVASLTEHGTGMSDQHRQELDAAQLIYTEADWLELRSTFRPKPTLDAPSAKRANQGAPHVPAASSQVPAAPSFPADVSVHAATSSAPADISVPAVSSAHVAVSVPAETVVHTAESHVDDPLTASEHVSTEPTVAAPTPSSSHTHRKHIAKKRVTPSWIWLMLQ
nr:hypothetical protein [Tanacetum cinerariifolium]